MTAGRMLTEPQRAVLALLVKSAVEDGRPGLRAPEIRERTGLKQSQVETVLTTLCSRRHVVRVEGPRMGARSVWFYGVDPKILREMAGQELPAPAQVLRVGPGPVEGEEAGSQEEGAKGQEVVLHRLPDLEAHNEEDDNGDGPEEEGEKRVLGHAGSVAEVEVWWHHNKVVGGNSLEYGIQT